MQTERGRPDGADPFCPGSSGCGDSFYLTFTVYPAFFQASTPPPRALTLVYPMAEYFAA
jgi:hypothetical protein